jgi:hypothetical protein
MSRIGPYLRRPAAGERYLRRIDGRWAVETFGRSGTSDLIYLTSKPQGRECETRRVAFLDSDGLGERKRHGRVFLARRRLQHWHRALNRIVDELADFVFKSHGGTSSSAARPMPSRVFDPYDIDSPGWVELPSRTALDNACYVNRPPKTALPAARRACKTTPECNRCDTEMKPVARHQNETWGAA